MQDNPNDPDVERELEKWADSQSRAEVSAELQHKMLGLLTQSLTPVTPIPSQGVLVLQFLGVFVLSAVAMVAIVNRTGLHLMTGAQTGWMSLVLAGGAVLFSITLARQVVPGLRPGLPVSGVVALSGLGLTAGIALNFPWMVSGGFVSEGWPCALMELMMVVPASLVFWMLARRGALFASAKLGAALIGLAVFMALVPLQAQCMFLQASHLLVWHAGTAAFLIGLGALMGSMRQRGRML